MGKGRMHPILPQPAAARGGGGRRPSAFFWVLVALSILTLTLGVWQWLAERRTLAAQSRPAAAERAPDFHLVAADGTSLSLADLRGQVVLLNFWATWCPPCKAEMPDLAALYRDYGTEHAFTVVGINVQESLAEVQAFADQNAIPFPLLLDPDGAVSGKAYPIRSLPTSMIIDRDGYVRNMWTGQIPKAAMLARLQQVW